MPKEFWGNGVANPTLDASKKIMDIHDQATKRRMRSIRANESRRSSWPGVETTTAENAEEKSKQKDLAMMLPPLQGIPIDPDLYNHWMAAMNGAHPQGLSGQDVLLIQVLRNQQRIMDGVNKYDNDSAGPASE